MTNRTAERIVNDPDGHFPYAADRAREAGVLPELVEASRRLVEAQEARLLDPSDENVTAERDAEKAAQEAGAAARRGRRTHGIVADEAADDDGNVVATRRDDAWVLGGGER